MISAPGRVFCIEGRPAVTPRVLPPLGRREIIIIIIIILLIIKLIIVAVTLFTSSKHGDNSSNIDNIFT